MVQSTPDHKFVDNFSAVVAGLFLFTFLIIVLAIVIASRTADVRQNQDDTYQALLEDRIRPIGDVVIAGRDSTLHGLDAVESMAVAAAPAAASSGAVAVADFASGEAVYNSACSACHGLGVAGAPKMGDAGQWAARVAKGNEALYQNAILGYQGSAGVMPAKGGRADLTDEHVQWAVDYMVDNSK